MPDKNDIKPLEVKKHGFYDNYVEATIDGMPVHLSAGAASWLKGLSDANRLEEMDQAIEMWGKRKPAE